MDLTQLRTFVTVVAEGHLTRAAERLNLSQPAASAHVRAIESEVGIELFERSNKGLEPTAAGRALATRAQKVLDAAAELTSFGRVLSGQASGTLNIGSNADPEFSRVGQLAGWLRQHHPLIELAARAHSSSATLQAVRNGELDAGFLLGPRVGGAIACRTLREIRYRVAGPAAWADRMASASWEELARMPWIVSGPGNAYGKMLDDLFKEKGLELARVADSDNDRINRAMIAAGVGLSLIREDLALQPDAAGRWSVSPLAVATTHLLFVVPAARANDPAIKALSDGVDAMWPDAIDRPFRAAGDGPH